MKFKEYIIENKQKITLGIIGLVAAGGFIYWLTRKPKQKQLPTPIVPLTQSKVSATSTIENEQYKQPQQNEHDRQFTQIVNNIKAQLVKTEYIISPQIMRMIIRGQYTLSNERIKDAIYKSRKLRRSKMKDPLQYAKIVTKHELQLQQIQQKFLGTILARFNIDKVTWNQACQDWQSKTTQQDQGIGGLIRQQENKLLLSLRHSNSKTIEFALLQQILKFKINELQTINLIQLGFNLGSDQATRFDMVQIYISDLVYNKFKVEPEDIQYSIEMLTRNKKQKIVQYQDKITELMQGLVGGDDEQGDGKQAELY